jgi:hypothetical protein
VNAAAIAVVLLCLALAGCVSVQRDASLDRSERIHHGGLERMEGVFANAATPDSSWASDSLMSFIAGDNRAYTQVTIRRLRPGVLYLQATGAGEGAHTITLLPDIHFTAEGARLRLAEAKSASPAASSEHEDPAAFFAYINSEDDLVIVATRQGGARYKGLIPYAASEQRFWYFERLGEPE